MSRRVAPACLPRAAQGRTAGWPAGPLPFGPAADVARALAGALLPAALQPGAVQPARDVRLAGALTLGLARAQAPPLAVRCPVALGPQCLYGV